MDRKYTSIPYTEYTVAEGRYDPSRAPIDRIVLHTTVGSMQSAINLFANTPLPGKETSAHYGVRYDGGLVAWLEEYYTAYHCGNYSFNQRSIGIEHEDMGDYNSPRPDTLYEASAALVADICKFYEIPCDSSHIVKHNQVPDSATACPSSLDTDRIIRRASEILQGAPVMAPDDWKKSRYDRILIGLLQRKLLKTNNSLYFKDHEGEEFFGIDKLRVDDDAHHRGYLEFKEKFELAEKDLILKDNEIKNIQEVADSDLKKAVADARVECYKEFDIEKGLLLEKIEQLNKILKDGVQKIEVKVETPLADRFAGKTYAERVKGILQILSAPKKKL